MKFILKLHPEITIKSKSVRLRFIKLLESNVRVALRRVGDDIKVDRFWDKLEVRAPDHLDRLAVIDKLRSTPGVAHVLEVAQYPFENLHDIYEVAQKNWGAELTGKTFCVRVKRHGKHDFSSIEVERYVGGGLNQHNDTAGVRLKNPDLTLNIEIDGDYCYLVQQRHEGLGGFPIKTQEDLLSLISGGFDSGVASYHAIRRGSRTHYCFFNLGGRSHEMGTKQMAYQLWERFGASHRVKFITVPFEQVVGEILEKIDDGLMGVVLKRMMVRAASQVAERMKIQALVTGEAVGQVSSQTLTNLAVIDKASEKLVLRPLIFMDKQEIVDTAKRIGTFDIAESMPEFCGVISKNPNVRADLAKVEASEAQFDMAVLDEALANAVVMDIRDIAHQAAEQVQEVATEQAVATGAVVLDIRPPEEQEQAPLVVAGHEVKAVPFYKLATVFAELPPQQTYYLYCQRGVMSQLQALYLQEQGFNNVRVYRPR